jgi:uncharacterized protein YdiU (UPF0061 family)
MDSATPKPPEDSAPPLGFDNSYARELGDLAVAWPPEAGPDPQLVILNHSLAADLGLDSAVLQQNPGFWSGNDLPAGASPIAQAYAGHQFGGFSPQLGDGRALLLGEVIDRSGQRRDIQLKGSGRTPFSRGGDGKAALGPMLREYLIGEAMQGLGIPSTRALAVCTTGETVLRDGRALPGAVLTRVAASHIRVGTFQFFAARKDLPRLRRLSDYTIARHYPQAATAADPALALFDAVAAAQIRLIAEWMGVGFVHGVMNTDNMALSGESIDFGPCAFMESYAPGTVFSSIDRQGRYAYGNQPHILGWNLARFAESLIPLIAAQSSGDQVIELMNARLAQIAPSYRAAWIEVMRRKLALDGRDEDDGALADDLLAAMSGQNADWTLTFRHLASAATGDDSHIAPLFDDPQALLDWLPRWRARLGAGAALRLRAANPAVIARNHLVEEALAAAQAGDLAALHALLAALADPFRDRDDHLMRPAPRDFGAYVTYCGT